MAVQVRQGTVDGKHNGSRATLLFLKYQEGLQRYMATLKSGRSGYKVCVLVAPGFSAAREILMEIGYGVR